MFDFGLSILLIGFVVFCIWTKDPVDKCKEECNELHEPHRSLLDRVLS